MIYFGLLSFRILKYIFRYLKKRDLVDFFSDHFSFTWY
jgi:hypothetical protein